MKRKDPVDWVGEWAPYDDGVYQRALSYLNSGDDVIDIGAGDLRFAKLASCRVNLLVALDNQHEVLTKGLSRENLPDNVIPFVGDFREWPLQHHFTKAVLLMRHCGKEDFIFLTETLRAAGCDQLVTNARWGLDVELVPLKSAMAYEQVSFGWFGCVRCGSTGFIEGDPENLAKDMMDEIHNVESCPNCW